MEEDFTGRGVKLDVPSDFIYHMYFEGSGEYYIGQTIAGASRIGSHMYEALRAGNDYGIHPAIREHGLKDLRLKIYDGAGFGIASGIADFNKHWVPLEGAGGKPAKEIDAAEVLHIFWGLKNNKSLTNTSVGGQNTGWMPIAAAAKNNLNLTNGNGNNKIDYSSLFVYRRMHPLVGYDKFTKGEEEVSSLKRAELEKSINSVIVDKNILQKALKDIDPPKDTPVAPYCSVDSTIGEFFAGFVAHLVAERAKQVIEKNPYFFNGVINKYLGNFFAQKRNLIINLAKKSGIKCEIHAFELSPKGLEKASRVLIAPVKDALQNVIIKNVINISPSNQKNTKIELDSGQVLKDFAKEKPLQSFNFTYFCDMPIKTMVTDPWMEVTPSGGYEPASFELYKKYQSFLTYKYYILDKKGEVALGSWANGYWEKQMSDAKKIKEGKPITEPDIPQREFSASKQERETQVSYKEQSWNTALSGVTIY